MIGSLWVISDNCKGSKEEISNSCGVSLKDLTAAKDYSQFYKEEDPLQIKCTTYLKTNLLYDLATGTISSFAEVKNSCRCRWIYQQRQKNI